MIASLCAWLSCSWIQIEDIFIRGSEAHTHLILQLRYLLAKLQHQLINSYWQCIFNWYNYKFWQWYSIRHVGQLMFRKICSVICWFYSVYINTISLSFTIIPILGQLLKGVWSLSNILAHLSYGLVTRRKTTRHATFGIDAWVS